MLILKVKKYYINIFFKNIYIKKPNHYLNPHKFDLESRTWWAF